MHGAEDHLDIMIFDKLKKFGIFCVKSSLSHLLSGEHIGREGDMEDLITVSRDTSVMMNRLSKLIWIKKQRYNRYIYSKFLLDINHRSYTIVIGGKTKHIALYISTDSQQE